MRATATLLFLLLTASADAQLAVAVRPDPPAPQAGQPFEVIVSGFWPTASLPVLRDLFLPSHNRIDILLGAEAEGDTVVTPFITRVPIPAIAPGQYTARVRVVEGGIVRSLAEGSFTVSGTDPGFTISPAFGGSSGGGVTTIFYPECGTSGCANARVFFGDREATQVKVHESFIGAVAPPAARLGLTDITVRIGTQDVVRHGAYTYVSPAQYETVLLPTHTDAIVPGGFGSRWKVDSSVFNGNEVDLEEERDYLHQLCLSVVLCPILPPIKAGAVNSIPTSFGFEREPNWLMHIRRPVADNLRFSLRVRDITRQEQTWGTELPVVRERDFATRVQLFDIPLQPRFRQTLRIYALPQGTTCCTDVTVRFYTLDGQPLHSTTATLRRSDIAVGNIDFQYPGSPDFPMQPENATLDFLGNIPQLAGRESVRVEVDGGSRAVWGMVTVTNNESQQVTVISPQ